MTPFLEVVRHDHDEHYVPGHDFLHAQMVAGYAWKIAGQPHTAGLARIAGLLHNYDRMGIEDQIPDRLSLLQLSVVSQAIIIEAVREHSKLNSDDDHEVTIALKDADRLANIGASFLIRLGQFRPDIPWINEEYGLGFAPGSTYQKPTSCVEMIKYVLEWEDMLRLPRAKKLAKSHFALMRMCLANMEQQMDEWRSA